MNRFAKFLEKQFKVEKDKLGIPSIIIVEGVERSLVQSIDRKSMLRVMSHFLNEVVALSYEKSNEEAQKYIDLKYQEYMDFVMKL